MFNTQSNSLSTAISSFLHSILGVLTSLLNSVLAVLQAIYALGAELFLSVLTLGRGIVNIVVQLASSLVGFIITNILAILVVVGSYYAYTRYYGKEGKWKEQKRTGKRRIH